MSQPFNQMGISTYNPLLLLRCSVTQSAKDVLDRIGSDEYRYQNNNVFVLNLEDVYACDNPGDMMNTLTYGVQREMLKGWKLGPHFPWHKFEVEHIKAIYGSESSFGSTFITAENVERTLQMVVQGRISGSYVTFQLKKKPHKERLSRSNGTYQSTPRAGKRRKQDPANVGTCETQDQSCGDSQVHAIKQESISTGVLGSQIPTYATPQDDVDKSQDDTPQSGLWNNLFFSRK